MEKYQNCELLIDGKNAFPAIFKCIQEAKESIYINMFIWRDDNIGNILAQALYDAAERGVKVHFDIDHYGVICELAEESKKSFFHKEVTFSEKMKINAIKKHYKGEQQKKNLNSDLYNKMIKHPNITISADVFKADHSKYYIFDDKILIMGGINVEDKENGHDIEGRIYQDYMVKISSSEEVLNFKVKLETGTNRKGYVNYRLNSKKINKFEMRETYLDMIKNAKRNIEINMAYFSPLKDFVKELIRAQKRGVEVRVMIPALANFQDNSNKKTVCKLLKKSKNKIEVLLTPKMMHTKMIIADDVISFGSCNITKKAFGQLDELNMMIFDDMQNPCAFVKTLLRNVDDNYALATKINNYKEIKYNRIVALIESLLV